MIATSKMTFKKILDVTHRNGGISESISSKIVSKNVLINNEKKYLIKSVIRRNRIERAK